PHDDVVAPEAGRIRVIRRQLVAAFERALVDGIDERPPASHDVVEIPWIDAGFERPLLDRIRPGKKDDGLIWWCAALGQEKIRRHAFPSICRIEADSLARPGCIRPIDGFGLRA